MKRRILEDTVILQSVCFFTNIKNRMHQEYDILIFDWSRKLIVAIEIKRKLSTKAINQLEKYHRHLEERLADQFGKGWTFHPVIFVSKDHLSFESHHYISVQTNIESWLSNIFKQYPVKSPINYVPRSKKWRSQMIENDNDLEYIFFLIIILWIIFGND